MRNALFECVTNWCYISGSTNTELSQMTKGKKKKTRCGLAPADDKAYAPRGGALNFFLVFFSEGVGVREGGGIVRQL